MGVLGSSCVRFRVFIGLVMVGLFTTVLVGAVVVVGGVCVVLS